MHCVCKEMHGCMRFSDDEFLFCTADIVIPNAEIILR